MNNEIQRQHFEIKRINQRIDRTVEMLKFQIAALTERVVLLEGARKAPEPAPTEAIDATKST